MATAAYHRWVDDGRPWKTARPVDALADTLRAHGYVCYTIGNEEHLQSDLPEDHAPIGKTGWPGKHPYGWVLALDIMPPKRGQRSKLDGGLLPSLQALGRRIYADKQAGLRGVAWVKYMNWEPDRDWGGRCWHDSWQPNHARRASSDRGHIHLSCRTDFHTSTVGDSYDPVARIRAAEKPPAPTPPEDDMPLNTDDKPIIGAGVLEARMGPQGSQGTLHNWLIAWRAEERLRHEALLAAAEGVDGDAVLARIDALAAEMAARAEEEEARDAQLLALVQQGLDGTLDAADVVARIGHLLTAGNTPDDA